jgi:acetyl esterase/lipase
MDLHGLCPCLLLVGTAEMLHDSVVAVAERARAAGVHVMLSEARDGVHMWLALGSMLVGFDKTMAEIGAFVPQHAAGASAHACSCNRAT